MFSCDLIYTMFVCIYIYESCKIFYNAASIYYSALPLHLHYFMQTNQNIFEKIFFTLHFEQLLLNVFKQKVFCKSLMQANSHSSGGSIKFLGSPTLV